jgi:hypothetical protein
MNSLMNVKECRSIRRDVEPRFGARLPQTEVMRKVQQRRDCRAGSDKQDIDRHALRSAVLDAIRALEVYKFVSKPHPAT